MTTPLKTVKVRPRIPERLGALKALSYNLRFAWSCETEGLFRRINADLWEETRHNPVALLGRLAQQDLQALEEDEGFLSHMDRVYEEFSQYVAGKPDISAFGRSGRPFTVAYFTAECGIAECLPIYSGGLGILSGDHLKSASDLNLPVIGVSLAYQKGYFRQYLSHDGWQMETYPVNDFRTMPMEMVREETGGVVKIAVDLKGETVAVQAWKAPVGRSVLYLLDTNLDENPAWAREITSELYGGDREMRIRQEMVLGIGGVRMLHAMGIDPAVYHMNEGHSAFAVFERIRALRERFGLSFNEALEYVRATSVFTTHTPVEAGNDMFAPDLVRAYFDGFAKAMGISSEVLLGFGRQDPHNREEAFCMTVLALRVANWLNGVSRLHAKVSRRMWRRVWPKTPEQNLPICHITNGVHIPSWISEGMAENHARYLGPRWIEDPDNAVVWERVERIPNTELWRTHIRARERLVAFTRRRLRRQMKQRGMASRELALADEVLNPDALTIGFARRFAPYKRAYLILRDLDRLERILTDKARCVQIIFAGKAHPQDHMGKELIKELVQISNQERFRRHMVFLEDYDMETARHLVQGADVWLNTPRRPLEACGTSGMKAVANGAIHLSVLDGWWEEGYDPEIGWAIGSGEDYDDHGYQDEVESRILYDILEKDVVPLFYDREADGLPRRWLAMMKRSLHKLNPRFNTHRMVSEYWDRFYLPAAERAFSLREQEWGGVKELAAWRERIMLHWGEVAIRDIRMDGAEEIEMGGVFRLEADVALGELGPGDVVVEAYCGRLDPAERFVDSFTSPMNPAGHTHEGLLTFRGEIHFEEVGHFGINLRITPNHPNPESRHAMGLVLWGEI